MARVTTEENVKLVLEKIHEEIKDLLFSQRTALDSEYREKYRQKRKGLELARLIIIETLEFEEVE